MDQFDLGRAWDRGHTDLRRRFAEVDRTHYTVEDYVRDIIAMIAATQRWGGPNPRDIETAHMQAATVFVVAVGNGDALAFAVSDAERVRLTDASPEALYVSAERIVRRMRLVETGDHE